METGKAPQFIEHISHGIDYTCYETRWIPNSAKMCSLGMMPKGNGVLDVFELEHGKLISKAKLNSKNAFKCGTFGASSFNNKCIATGDFKGNVEVYSLENLSASSKPTWKPNKESMHEKPINCIDAIGGLGIGYGAPEIVTGCREGIVKVWDPRLESAVVSLIPEKYTYEGSNKLFTNSGNPQEGSTLKKDLPTRDCWTVCFGGSFNNQERQVSAGYDNGDLKVFDLRKNKVIWETNLMNGICGIEYDRKDIKPNKLVCTTLESRIVLFDVRVEQTYLSKTTNKNEKHPYLSKKAHKSTIWGCKHLPQNRDIFMTLGGNGALNLYKYQYPAVRKKTTLNGDIMGVIGKLELLNTKIISTQPIISFDWNKDKEGLCCLTAMDQTVRVFIVTNLQHY